MCGRYVRRSDKQKLAEAFHLGKLPPDFVLAPDYNVAPKTFQPIIRLNAETGERELTQMRWGLIPYWSKDDKIAFKTTNARAETVATNNVFKEAFKRRHCLVPADLFYEWQNLNPADEKRKNTQPYAIGRKDGEPMAFAGLWESWIDKRDGKPLETFTIITTDPNALMEPLHDRMPVILPRSDYDRWLAPVDPVRPPVDLLRPHAAEEMKAWKVDKAVGNVRNVGPELCMEWDGPSDSLFA
jgi:putative SOS response-associated peptidase YedK